MYEESGVGYISYTKDLNHDKSIESLVLLLDDPKYGSMTSKGDLYYVTGYSKTLIASNDNVVGMAEFFVTNKSYNVNVDDADAALNYLLTADGCTLITPEYMYDQKNVAAMSSSFGYTDNIMLEKYMDTNIIKGNMYINTLCGDIYLEDIIWDGETFNFSPHNYDILMNEMNKIANGVTFE